MLDALSQAMVKVFWFGLGVILAADIVLAIARRQTFSNKARWVGMDLPVLAYGLGLLPTHFWLNFPIVGGFVGGALMLATAVAIVAYEKVDGDPLHPMIAWVLGTVSGIFLFPN
jgi:hypothetical protein